MATTNRNEAAALTRLGLSTFLNIWQMAQYRYQYAQEKERQKDSPDQANADELAWNRDKMIKYAGFAVFRDRYLQFESQITRRLKVLLVNPASMISR